MTLTPPRYEWALYEYAFEFLTSYKKILFNLGLIELHGINTPPSSLIGQLDSSGELIRIPG